MPLVDVVGHLDHAAIEAKSSELFGAAFVHIGFDLDLHGVLAIAAKQSLAFHRRGGAAQPESAGPAPPARQTGVSPGVFGQDSCGSFRHASSVDWFIA